MEKTKFSKEMKTFVKDCLDRAVDILGVPNYDIDIYYMLHDKTSENDNRDLSASMSTDLRYLKATLKIYPPVMRMWKKGDRDEIKDTIHHEIAHIVTQHLVNLASSPFHNKDETEDAWESLTTLIGRLSVRIDNLKSKR